MEKEQIQEKRIQIVRDSLFFAAYTLWMFRSFIKTTFFFDVPAFVWIADHVHDTVFVFCVIVYALEFRFKAKEIAGLFLTVFLFGIAWSDGAKAVSYSILLIYAARHISYRRIMQWTIAFMSLMLTWVVGSSLLGVIENHVFVQGAGRVRYGLGFLYCSYASHYLLLFFMLYLVLREKVRWYEVALLLALNLVGYHFTDTKTDMISLALMIGVTVVLRLLRNKKICLRIFAYLGAVTPFIFWGISLVTAKMYTVGEPMWEKVNMLLNSRLYLGKQALGVYPIHMFGQKIDWVGGSAMLKDPTLTYNYVDNNYLSVTLHMGVLVAFFMCLGYGRALYLSVRKGQLALAAGLFVFMVIGLVNPEMRNLLYNTFLLVLMKPADCLEGIETWKPRKEWKKNAKLKRISDISA